MTALVTGAGLTVISLATPAWRQAKAATNVTCSGTNCISAYSNAYSDIKDGLFNTMCSDVSSCQNYYNVRPQPYFF